MIARSATVAAAFLAIVFGIYSIADAVQLTVPSSSGAGFVLVSTSTGAYIATTTSPLHATTFYAQSQAVASFLPYASTTALTATTLCLTGDTCRTTWPASGGGGSGTVSTSSAESSGFLAYWTSNSATPALLGKVATSAPGVTGPITYSGTFGAFVGGTGGNFGCATCNTTNATVSSIATTYPITGGTITTTGTLGFSGVATSAAPTIGNLAYWTSDRLLGTVATGTVSAGSSAITVTAGRAVLGGSLAIDCTTATGSQTGCLSGTDWSTFNGKQASLGYVPWGGTLSTTFATTTIASTTPLWAKTGIFASSTSQLDQASSTAITTGTLWDTSLTSVLALFDANHKETAYGGASSCGANNFFTGLSAAGASSCGNSTIGATSPNSTLSFGAAAAFGATFTGDINLGTSNQWTASTTITKVLNLQNASSSLNTLGTVWIPAITSALLLNDSSGKATAYGGSSCSNQFPRSASALGAWTCSAVSLTADITGTLGAGNGGTGATSLSPAFTVASNVFSNVITRSFTYSTTTTWTATTTIPLEQASVAETISGVRCLVYPRASNLFLNIQFGIGTASTTMLNASSTNNFNSFTTNNTLAAGNSLSVDIGTTSAAITAINCSVKFTI